MSNWIYYTTTWTIMAFYLFDQHSWQPRREKRRHAQLKKETVAAIVAELKKSDNVLVIKEDLEGSGVVQ